VWTRAAISLSLTHAHTRTRAHTPAHTQPPARSLTPTQPLAPTQTLGSGLQLRDIKIGGGNSPNKGDFVGVNVLVKDGDEVLLDTNSSGRPIAFTMGRRPYTSVVCAGLEEGVTDMKRGGVRELVVPPELGFGAEGRVLPSGVRIRGDATLSYSVTLEDVSPSYL
jgi:FKBP-type peptidyl-prolyl cis-trans isomerase